ncbi:uncharacterized protein LOC100575956 isoform X2 [Acyrthosiphon pisum]|uniref:ZSWIM3 N-terminal domain-containing protein n=1 Tax=Acyrthosiphon pisum TaxID=7029 RepID=A0A8R1W3S1_ACYPI|nr:uncharacterized protein LOC100575956 isoform X2 [Acyrthosiphon pisum]|eukprot:XP_003240149.2 PREDICTED: uncharacterized protein LOC100575956 isoform X2 [Acyrthosiphon pisum]
MSGYLLSIRTLIKLLSYYHYLIRLSVHCFNIIKIRFPYIILILKVYKKYIKILTMRVGDVFKTYADFEEALSQYKKSTFVDFYIKDSKTAKSQIRRYPKLANSSEQLKYYYVKLACVHGGSYRKKNSCQDLRSTSSMRQGCEAYIYLIANAKGDALELTRMNDEHNHEKSETLFSHLPNQRRVTPQEKMEVLELMKLKANKKLIQHKMQTKTGKVINLKDIANIYTTGKTPSHNSLSEIVEQLQNTYNCTVEISADSDQNLIGLFIQDKIMQNTFKAFPEVGNIEVYWKLDVYF